jgi:lactoylglutathione lyase
MRKIFLLLAFIVSSIGVHAQKPYATFDHVGILVHDLEKSTAFYIKILDLDSTHNPWPGQRAKWFKLGAYTQFHLMEDKTDSLCVPLFNHICFSVASITDFIAKLNREKVDYFNAEGKRDAISNLRTDGVKQIFFKDPDGYVIEVNDAIH